MTFLTWLQQLPISVWMKGDSLLAFPTFLFLHTLGMSIVAGGSALIDLALLGFWPVRTPLKPLERLYPLIWTGFWINFFTGVMLLISDAARRLTNPDFQIKILCVLAGVAVLVVMRKKVFGDSTLDTEPVSWRAKGLAWASLLCWFGAIVSGRLLAYTGARH